MRNLPLNLKKKLERRRENNSFRNLGAILDLTDFSSNDYLGFAKSAPIFKQASKLLQIKGIQQNGSTGSRLLSGNYSLYEETEAFLAKFHQSEAALIFNSGYDANIGFFSSVPQRGDLVFYDELIHASIRDGLRLSLAKSYKFKHNDLANLKSLINRFRPEPGREMFVVTETVFSMDGDSPDLKSMASFCTGNNCSLVVDEAHAMGVFGEKGEGLISELRIAPQVFARINTFGKALGCHGAVVLGNTELINYLVNFSRSFIYTTALPPHSIATILAAYGQLTAPEIDQQAQLRENISFFTAEIEEQGLQSIFIPSNSAIHCCGISGNENAKYAARFLQAKGFDVKPILSPTVPVGKERLRFCVHSYNSKQEISEVLETLATFVEQERFRGSKSPKG